MHALRRWSCENVPLQRHDGGAAPSRAADAAGVEVPRERVVGAAVEARAASSVGSTTGEVATRVQRNERRTDVVAVVFTPWPS